MSAAWGDDNLDWDRDDANEQETIAKPLPCPFCGTQPQFASITDLADNFDHGFTIWCEECGIDMHDEYRDDVLKRWNSRSALQQEPANDQADKSSIT